MNYTAQRIAISAGLILTLASGVYADDGIKPKAQPDSDSSSTSESRGDSAEATPALSLTNWEPQYESHRDTRGPGAFLGAFQFLDTQGGMVPRILFLARHADLGQPIAWDTCTAEALP